MYASHFPFGEILGFCSLCALVSSGTGLRSPSRGTYSTSMPLRERCEPMMILRPSRDQSCAETQSGVSKMVSTSVAPVAERKVIFWGPAGIQCHRHTCAVRRERVRGAAAAGRSLEREPRHAEPLQVHEPHVAAAARLDLQEPSLAPVRTDGNARVLPAFSEQLHGTGSHVEPAELRSHEFMSSVQQRVIIRREVGKVTRIPIIDALC